MRRLVLRDGGRVGGVTVPTFCPVGLPSSTRPGVAPPIRSDPQGRRAIANDIVDVPEYEAEDAIATFVEPAQGKTYVLRNG